MKFSTLLLLLFFSASSFAQVTNVKLSGMIFKTGQDSIFVSQAVDGSNYQDFFGAALDEDGNFEMEGTVPAPNYYVVRIGGTRIPVILRQGSEIKLYGDGRNLDQYLNIVNSQESSDLVEYLRLVSDWQRQSNEAGQAINANPAIADSINREMSAKFNQFKSQKNNFVARHGNSAALYPAFRDVNPQQDFATYKSLASQLIKAFPESPMIQQVAVELQEQTKLQEKNNILAPGKEAPDFEEKKIDGETTMKLSDLRGKVVLLDFWASWCGPCRKENPAVVALYNKYKDDGFTIMSVSLDKNRDSWIAAIKKDGLTWPNHVSDLNFWSSRVPKMYNVRGIPFTVLIDEEGNIIKTKLRAHQLEIELKRIFEH
ncbi:MAG: TlpA disulfide reductase family protein [Crocinitomicaceae bacterium]|nr:TlpA disulfide reductase family protein [Crocinitomicaceae bacterium]